GCPEDILSFMLTPGCPPFPTFCPFCGYPGGPRSCWMSLSPPLPPNVIPDPPIFPAAMSHQLPCSLPPVILERNAPKEAAQSCPLTKPVGFPHLLPWGTSAQAKCPIHSPLFLTANPGQSCPEKFSPLQTTHGPGAVFFPGFQEMAPLNLSPVTAMVPPPLCFPRRNPCPGKLSPHPTSGPTFAISPGLFGFLPGWFLENPLVPSWVSRAGPMSHRMSPLPPHPCSILPLPGKTMPPWGGPPWSPFAPHVYPGGKVVLKGMSSGTSLFP
ncbi:extensin-like, partial [Penaeus monodon]|uniref:extensin-like n=1 Tax=Penaeus monodon TaxID=6687 RepID=UPI0018A77BBC